MITLEDFKDLRETLGKIRGLNYNCSEICSEDFGNPPRKQHRFKVEFFENDENPFIFIFNDETGEMWIK